MYGLIGQFFANPGQRDALVEILIEASANMPGCRSYVVSKDADDESAIWVSEVWDSKEAHAAALDLPAVQAAIARGRPMIAGMGARTETVPMGGVGI